MNWTILSILNYSWFFRQFGYFRGGSSQFGDHQIAKKKFFFHFLAKIGNFKQIPPKWKISTRRPVELNFRVAIFLLLDVQ